MSTFRQIVEGYAGNVEQQRRSMDYEGANDRAIDKIKERNTNEIEAKLEELPTKLRLANKAYNDGYYREYNSGRHMSSDARSEAAHKVGEEYMKTYVKNFDNSFNEILNNPNLSTKHLVSLHAIVDGISDNSTLGSKKRKLHRAIISHKNSDDFVRGFHYARTGHDAPWKNNWDE
ncbi:MAG: hypothetical protein E6R13_05220 [Spirochaetes bacterium]|nr:MAG: hypothetical protein E6R13_05220 [Spirochaetota bacterium]